MAYSIQPVKWKARVIGFTSTFIVTAAQTAFAAGIVTSNTDANLRAALAGGGTVTFAIDGTIVLTNTLVISSDTTIDASGHDIILDGNNTVRHFWVSSTATLTLTGLSISRGYFRGANSGVGDGGPGFGGAVYLEGGTLILESCRFFSNSAAGGDGRGLPLGSPPVLLGNGGAAYGGAIYLNGGFVYATNTEFAGNLAVGGRSGGMALCDTIFEKHGGFGNGGAIASVDGNLIFHDCTFISNNALGGIPGICPLHAVASRGNGLGGAIFNAGSAVIEQCHFSFNKASFAEPSAPALRGGSGRGGAIDHSVGSITIRGCSFLTNSAQASAGSFPASSPGVPAVGGAISSESQLQVEASLFAGNTSLGGAGSPGGDAFGGALYVAGTSFLTNVTITANGSLGGNSTFGKGGGLYVTNSTSMLVNVTFADNAAADSNGISAPSGYGANTFFTNSTVQLLNTLLAGSLTGGNSAGNVIDLGHNLSSDGSCAFYATGSLNNTDPKLGPLDDYGGNTLTMPLLASSPAIDAGDSAAAPTTDQRGRTRPYGSSSDIGAFESSPPYFIGGVVSGSTLTEDVLITAGSESVSSTSHGSYLLKGLDATTHMVMPSSPNYLFLPNNRSITVGPDQLGVNFNAYRWNELSLDGVTNNMMHLIFAGTNGHTYRLLASSNFVEWEAVETNTIGLSSYFETSVPISGHGFQFFRTVDP